MFQSQVLKFLVEPRALAILVLQSFILYLISSLHIQSASLCSKAELSDHKSMIFKDIISQAVRFLSKSHIRILRASLCLVSSSKEAKQIFTTGFLKCRINIKRHQL